LIDKSTSWLKGNSGVREKNELVRLPMCLNGSINSTTSNYE